jgi:DNA polymerase-3 subunit delta
MIEVSDIDELVSPSMSYQIWDLTDAVIAGRADRAFGVLQAMDEREHAPQLLIFMIIRQYRQLLLAQAMLREGMSADQVGAHLRLSPFPLKKVTEQATRYPTERLEAAYRRLLETDVAVKTGVLDVMPALEMLIVDLTALAQLPARALVRSR